MTKPDPAILSPQDDDPPLDHEPSEIGARHGQIAGIWRILLIGLALSVVALAAAAVLADQA